MRPPATGTRFALGIGVRPRSLLLVALVVVAATPTTIAPCRLADDASSAPQGPPPASDGPPGIVLLCLDTLRADMLALDTQRPVRLPRLEAFARESVAFADAVAPAAWTGPSVTSMLTGLDPSRSGVLGLPERVGEPPEHVVTLPRRLAEAGWDTAAVTTGAFVDARLRVMRGFREVGADLDRDPAAVIRAWSRRRRPDAPFFLFLHSLAAHDPYLDKDASGGAREPTGGFDAPRALELRARLADRDAPLPDADARWLLETVTRSAASRRLLQRSLGRPLADRALGAVNRWLDDGSERDPGLSAAGDRLRADYERGLAYVDALVGRILDGLAEARLPAGTAVIVVADHGEAFGEHGTLLHGRRLFDEVVRVPFVVRAPARSRTGRVVHGAAGLVDVVPTVLELAGLPVPAGLDGFSLVEALAEGAELPRRAMKAYEERRRFVGGEARVERLESIRTPRAKLLLRRDAATRRVLAADVYDLLVDPGERTPLPLDDLDSPCEFGDDFALALEDAGFAVPCLALAREARRRR